MSKSDQIGTRRVHRWFATVLGVCTVVAMVVVGVLSGSREASAAQPPVELGTAASFAVLAGQTVTNTGPSVLTGDLGVSPKTAITGFPPGLVLGTQHSADAVALQAQEDLTTAYNDAAGRAPAVALPPDLGGLTLVAGVYNAPSALGLTGTVTLDAKGDPNGVFIFQVGSTLITASNSTVSFINGANPCNVFWQVGSSATLGTGTTFVGNILALTSAGLDTGATVNGRVLARNGAVTLDTNVIVRPNCSVPPTETTDTETPTETTDMETPTETIDTETPTETTDTETPTETTDTETPTETTDTETPTETTDTGVPTPAETTETTPAAPVVPAAPEAPPIPDVPGTPGVPGAPGTPGVPGAPGAPGAPGGSDVIPAGHPETGSGGAAQPDTSSMGLVALGGLSVYGAGFVVITTIGRRRHVLVGRHRAPDEDEHR